MATLVLGRPLRTCDEKRIPSGNVSRDARNSRVTKRETLGHAERGRLGGIQTSTQDARVEAGDWQPLRWNLPQYVQRVATERTPSRNRNDQRADRSSPQRYCLGNLGEIGGRDRNRTDVHGFAIRCITTLPLGQTGQSAASVKRRGRNRKPRVRAGFPEYLERETRLELATPTLARLCSTN